MFASVTFNFETREDLESALLAFAGVKRSAPGATATASTEARVDEQAEPAPAPEKPKRGRPAKVEPEQAEPTEPTRKAALGTIINAIRSFVLADKVGNMRKLIPLMPEGKKSLDSLDLEEAQRIALQLGLEVG
jgi:hypothetical protein